MASAPLAVGLVLESKDRVYEPDRRIRLISPLGVNGWVVETVANPRRPNRVPSRTSMSTATLRKRWCRPTVECDSCGGRGGASLDVCSDCMGSGRKWDENA